MVRSVKATAIAAKYIIIIIIMAMFEQLHVEAFWEDPKKEFERVSGPRPEWKKDYNGIDSVMKNKLMWDFFESP